MEYLALKFYTSAMIKDQQSCDQIFLSLSTSDMHEFTRHYTKIVAGNKRKNYHYLITFTLKPNTSCDEENIKLIQDYIISQLTQRPSLQIKEAHIVKELTKNNMPHWHCAVRTHKCIKKDRFNYYIKKYGFIDICKTHAQTLQESINYMSKSNTPTKLSLDIT